MTETVISPASTPKPGPTGTPPPSGSPRPSHTSHPPTLSALRLSSTRFAANKRTTLKLTLSQAAKVRVLITQTVRGRAVTHACKRNAKQGKRCTVTITKRTLSFAGKAKANAFKLTLRGLAKGSYTAAVSAHNANGSSPTAKLEFRITHK
jgi:hypothetical protein